ncbi:MAG: hypothetical protein JO251_16575 [Verrucomicrobia bacterium]|nr:hypothetical protein [Verrucomicrobiota bacterium]
MNLVSPKIARLTLCVCFTLVPAVLQAQNQAAAPSQSPGAKPGPSAGQPKFTDQQMQEIILKLRERIGNAADQVFGRIQKEENGLHISFTYLRKPDRLDPSTYGSKDDIAQWRASIEQMKEKENLLEKLYANADEDLGNALTQQKINQAIAEQIKNELLKTFPWNTIKKRNELMRDYIAEHDELLTFYEKNWGSWKSGPDAGTPTFDDKQLAATYRTLKEKINTTGLQLEDQYKVLVQ